MQLGRRHIAFTPTWVPTLAALLAVGLTGYLGHWQQGRAAEKRALQAEWDARYHQPVVSLSGDAADPALRYRRARADGVWQDAAQFFIDNRVLDDRAGFHVITPFKLADGGRILLVNRGWVARGTAYPAPPAVAAPVGPAMVSGQLVVPSSRYLELSPRSVQGKVWQNLSIERVREASKLDLLPFVLLAADSAVPLRPVSERPDAGVAKHVEYMLTWYSLALTVCVLWLALNTRISRVGSADRTSTDKDAAA
jgi:surfeit locus 1 family protein